MPALSASLRPVRLIPADPGAGRPAPCVVLRDEDGRLLAWNLADGSVQDCEPHMQEGPGLDLDAAGAGGDGAGSGGSGASPSSRSAFEEMFSSSALQAMMQNQLQQFVAQAASSMFASMLRDGLASTASGLLDNAGSLTADAIEGLADQVLSGDLLFGLGAQTLGQYVFGSLWAVDAESSAGEVAAHTVAQKFGLQAASLLTESSGVEKMLVRTFRGEPSDAAYPLAVTGSSTNHGGTCIGGAGKTLGRGVSVARFEDQQMCPMGNHVQGAIFEGNELVLIEGKPAARFGHQASCDGAGAITRIVEPRPDILLGLAPGEVPPPPDPGNPLPNDPSMDLNTPAECTGVGDVAQNVGVDAKPACVEHDACYGMRGTPDDRAVCDADFGANIANTPPMNGLGGFFGPIVAGAYEAAVSLFGWMFYEYTPGSTDRASSLVDRATMFLRDLVRKVWNLPNTIIGGLIGGIGHLMQWAAHIWDPDKYARPGWSWGNNALQFHNNALIDPGAAMTIGNIVMYGLGGEIHGAHEMQHTIQGEMLGPFYLPAIGVSYAYSNFASDLPTLGERVHSEYSFMETGPQRHPAVPFDWWPIERRT